MREEGVEQSGGGSVDGGGVDTDRVSGGRVGSCMDARGTDVNVNVDADVGGAGPATTDSVARELGGSPNSAAFWVDFLAVLARVPG